MARVRYINCIPSVNEVCLLSSSWQSQAVLGLGGQYLSSMIGRQQSPPSNLQSSLLKSGLQIWDPWCSFKKIVLPCKFIKEFGMDIGLTWMTKKKMQDYLFRLFYSFFCHFYLKILPLLYQLIVVASSSWIREISSISISSVVISVKTKMTFIMVQPQ